MGFKGQMVDDGNGNKVEGFQVHLGGTVTRDTPDGGKEANFGRKIRGHKVLSSELEEYVSRVVGNYVDKRNEGEIFRDWVLRADEEDLK